MDDINNGQRIDCNGVFGTVIGNRSIRNRRLVLVKMDNGFTLKLNAHTLSVIKQPVAVTEVEETAQVS